MDFNFLLAYLQQSGVLQSPRVIDAFKNVDRAHFVPKELKDEAYGDYPLPIGHGATISQPTTVAFMLEKLNVQPGDKVLDIGSGSGWTTALLAYLAGPKGKVIGLEIVPELARLGQRNLIRCYSLIRENKRIREASAPEIREATNGVAGLPAEGPWDRILVSAAAREIPKELIEQLGPDGIMVIPVGVEYEMQKLVRIRKKPDGKIETEEYPGFVFVSLQ
jgi:protein-L-isoaspartate(D-aspartate) O-methyltransferase